MKAKKAGKKPETPEESEPTPPIVVIDPYESLRYQQPPLPPVGDPFVERTVLVPVLKAKGRKSVKRRSVTTDDDIELVEKGKGHCDGKRSGKGDGVYDCLRMEMVDPEPLTHWTQVHEGIEGVEKQAIFRPDESDKLFQRDLHISFGKESAALHHFKKTKLQQLSMENHCMKHTQKDRRDLLLRRDQFLPHLSSTGREVSKIEQIKFAERKSHEGNLSCKESVVPASDGQESHREQIPIQPVLDATTEWVGCPEITDEIRDELQENVDHLTQLLASRNASAPMDFGPPTETPSFPTLGVLGLKYHEAQRRIKEMIRRGKRRTSKKFRTHPVADDANSEMSMASRQAICDIKESDVEEHVSLVRLSIGDVNLSWKTDLDGAKEVKVIELGCTAEFGKSAVNWISMKNTGSTAIYFDWMRSEKMAELSRIDERSVIFDTAGGVILPSEEFRLPVMYKAIRYGFYSEDWCLVTKPVLENGAPVILRLWGFSRQYDPYIQARSRIKEMLKERMVHTICRLRVDKIVNYLPLNETALNEAGFPQVHDTPEAFVYNNPGLRYHSADVYALGKLRDLIQAQLDRENENDLNDEQDEIAAKQDRLSVVKSSSVRYENWSRRETKIETQSISGFMSMVSLSMDPTIYDGMLKRIRQVTDIDTLKIKASQTNRPSVIAQRSALSTEREDSEGEGSSGDDVSALDNVRLDDLQPDDHSTPATPKPRKTLTNIVDPNLVVDAIRSGLLRCQGNQPFQEAAFHVMATCVDRLQFTVEMAKDDWKLTVCRGLLTQSMEKFSEYAAFLEEVCFIAEEETKKLEEFGDSETEAAESFEGDECESNTTGDKKSVSKSGGSATGSIQSNRSPQPDQTNSINSEGSKSTTPLTTLPPDRYVGVYHQQLEMRMHQVLSDVCVQLDFLLGGPKTLAMDWEREGFTRVQHIPWNMDLTRELERPMPPPWIQVAQRIEGVRATLRDRQQALEEMECASV